MIARILLFLLIFVATLVVRFPYEAAIADRIGRLEAATGMRVDYKPKGASMFGVDWDDVHITSPSGLNISFQRARLRPGLTGLSAYGEQKDGQARLSVDTARKVTVKMDKLILDSGSPKFGVVKVTGDMTHELAVGKGEANLRLELPNFQAPLPVEIKDLESGNRIFWQSSGSGTEVRAEVSLQSTAQNFNAAGNVRIDPVPGGPARLNGSLPFQSPLGKGTFNLSGTWKNPEWQVVRQSS